jgi:excisionase family DNA binding protein
MSAFEGKLVIPGLGDELRLIVREEVARALEIGGAGGYLNAKSAASYLDTSPDAIKSMVRDGKLEPVRRQPRMLFTRDELDRWVRDEAS